MYIYKFTNCFNSQSYIGQTYDFTKRLKWHKKSISDTSVNTKFVKALRYFGFNNFSFTVLFECNFEDVDLLENYCMDLYDTLNNGYNTAHKDYNKNKAIKVYNSIMTGNYIVYEPYRFINGKSVICLNDNEIFNSVSQCESYYGVSHVGAVCKGQRATSNNLVFRYLDENGNIIEPKISTRKKTREVYVEETGLIYESIVDAIRDINENMDNSVINAHLQGKSENAYGFHFHYVENDEILPSNYKDRRHKRKILVDNMYQFDSVSEAIEYYNLPTNARGAISQNARGRSSSAYGHTWSYIDDDTGEAIVNEFKHKVIDRSKVKRYEIICDNRYTFKSLAEVCRYFNYNINNAKVIAKCCKGELTDAFGHTWKYGKQL